MFAVCCRLCVVEVTVKLFNASDSTLRVDVDTRVSHNRLVVAIIITVTLSAIQVFSVFCNHSAFAHIVHVRKFHLLTYVLTFYAVIKNWTPVIF